MVKLNLEERFISYSKRINVKIKICMKLAKKRLIQLDALAEVKYNDKHFPKLHFTTVNTREY